jgi:amidase
MTDFAFYSTTALARAIAMGDISSAELVELYAERHEVYGSAINALVQVDFDHAMDQAKAADDVLASGAEIEPLHGVPFTIKDTFEVQGFACTAGAPEYASHRPAEDSDAVINLRKAGAVIMGKTNVPYMAMDLQSYNDVYGTTNNPWALDCTAGGSSGGAAAALAAGLTGGDVGSDIGGSLRNPAHYNGVYSHKPSFGLVSQRGHVPPPPATQSATDLTVIGPMGRSVEDLSNGLSSLMQPVGLERHAAITLPPSRHRQLEDFRVAMWPGHQTNRPSKAVAGRFDALKGALKDNVDCLEELWPLTTSYPDLMDLYSQLLLGAISAGSPAWQFRLSQLASPVLDLLKLAGLFDPKGVTGMMRFTAQSHRSWLIAHEKRTQLRAEIDAFFGRFDVLLMPVMPWTAPPHNPQGQLVSREVSVDGRQRPYTDGLGYIALATTLYLPVTTAPIGLSSDGLPVGVQIIGGYMKDKTTLAFAEALAGLMGGYVPPPDFKGASDAKSP